MDTVLDGKGRGSITFQYEVIQANQSNSYFKVTYNTDGGSIQNPLLKPFKLQHAKQVNSIPLSHELNRSATQQIIGHSHPNTAIRIRSHTIVGKCFLVDSTMIIMPAFASHTDGLDISSPVFEKVINKNHTKCFFLKAKKIWLLRAC